MLKFLDILLFTLERLRKHRVLVFWVLVGLTAAVTLALSLVLYVDAVNTDLLASRLDDPPYAFRFRYLGSWEGNITPADVSSATAAIENRFTGAIGLPVTRQVSFVRSRPWTVRLASDGGMVGLGAFNLGMLQGADDQIHITAGVWPPESENDNEAIPALISETMLFEMGLEVGDTLNLAQAGQDPVELHVAALWQPVNPDDPSWIFTPRFFNEVLLVRPDDFWTLADGINEPVEESAWFMVFDGSQVRTPDAIAMLDDISAAERDVTTVLPGTRMDLSPVDGLRAFSDQVTRLTQQLVIILLPVGGMVFYFVSLVAGLLVNRQQAEDVILHSRGMSRSMLLGVYVLMWLLLGGTALAVGIMLSPLVVQLVGQTSSFLRFDTGNPPLDVVLTGTSLAVGAGTALLAASTGLFLAWRSTNQTITGYQRRSVRSSRAWWQRMNLDVMLFVPGCYVLYSLWQRGGLEAEADNPFADPLTFVGPTLFALGLTLLFLRLWPLLLRLGARLIAYTRNISLLMALRELTRSIGRYRGTLLMMCFTLSLTGLTASMASTIDRSLIDTINYRVGADAVLVMAVDVETEQDETQDTSGQPTYTVTGFNTVPPDDLLGIDGVESVARVGRYPARLVVRNQRIDGTVLGIDRTAAAAVTRSRHDYADQPLAELFNRLAGNRTGILLSEQTLVANDLLIGQEIELQISVLGEWYQTRVPVLGVMDYFPTLDPDAGFFAITSLDPIFELVGTELPHDFWLSLKENADPQTIQRQVRELGFPLLEWRDPESRLQEARADPSRRGVLGFLSIGFVASIGLTLVGAIIQNTASFRAQTVQIGSLRAMGLSGLSSALYLLLVQGIAASSGVLGGTAIGVLTTLLFLPLLDFSSGLPPYLVRVAWDEIIMVYVVFAGVLFAVTVLMTVIASLEQLATVIKLGDAQ